MPPEVDVRLVAPLPVDGTGQRFEGVVGPVDSWYSVELGKGELAKLWRFLREPEGDERELDGHGIGKTEALRQLWLTLERCSLYPAHKAELYAAAAGSATLDEFKARYDQVIAEIVATFHGEHTAFMWEDPAFAPWLSRTLADRPGGQS